MTAYCVGCESPLKTDQVIFCEDLKTNSEKIRQIVEFVRQEYENIKDGESVDIGIIGSLFIINHSDCGQKISNPRFRIESLSYSINIDEYDFFKFDNGGKSRDKEV